jgi:hypothetical protein
MLSGSARTYHDLPHLIYLLAFCLNGGPFSLSPKVGGGATPRLQLASGLQWLDGLRTPGGVRKSLLVLQGDGGLQFSISGCTTIRSEVYLLLQSEDPAKPSCVWVPRSLLYAAAALPSDPRAASDGSKTVYASHNDVSSMVNAYTGSNRAEVEKAKMQRRELAAQSAQAVRGGSGGAVQQDSAPAVVFEDMLLCGEDGCGFGHHGVAALRSHGTRTGHALPQQLVVADRHAAAAHRTLLVRKPGDVGRLQTVFSWLSAHRLAEVPTLRGTPASDVRLDALCTPRLPLEFCRVHYDSPSSGTTAIIGTFQRVLTGLAYKSSRGALLSADAAAEMEKLLPLTRTSLQQYSREVNGLIKVGRCVLLLLLLLLLLH